MLLELNTPYRIYNVNADFEHSGYICHGLSAFKRKAAQRPQDNTFVYRHAF